MTHKLLAALVAVAYATRSLAAAPAPREPDLARPLAWLVAAQGKDGGWGPEPSTPADVATTSIAALALVRLGHTPASGAHKASVAKAVEYVVAAVEKVPIPVVDVNGEGTQPQRKLGRHIDTFLAAQFLGEVAPFLPEGEGKGRAMRALDNCAYKIGQTQEKDGSFSGGAWAPVLQSAFAAQGLYAAKKVGVIVPLKTTAGADKYMLENYDARTGQFKTTSAAGVSLYAAASTIRSAAAAGKMDEAPARAALKLLSDESFVRGYGTYGGEEHVSYMFASEAVAQAGGVAWDKWSESIRARLGNIQRADGNWRGDHCITSTVFCTAASLITLAVRPLAAARPG